MERDWAVPCATCRPGAPQQASLPSRFRVETVAPFWQERKARLRDVWYAHLEMTLVTTEVRTEPRSASRAWARTTNWKESPPAKLQSTPLRTNI